MANDEILKVRDKLNNVSPSFCLAKWYQVTIHLQNGQTHSCHHPWTHKVDVRDLISNPSALHNTPHKKIQRYKMLKGERPAECDYCWKIEDSSAENISDRTFKSAENWAMPNFEEAKTMPWDYDFMPRYVEVSFSHACNFKCVYCFPHISSSIMNEFQKFGHYQVSPEYSLQNLEVSGHYPIAHDTHNPYVEAFWRWWPELIKTLEHFRITGGEPLINPNTFRFLDYIKLQPQPKLNFAINSNLGIPDAQFDRFLSSMKVIIENKSIRSFEFYTSVDTHGEQAEYIRDGLNYVSYMKNIRKFLDTLPAETKIIFMCTFNALSVPTFRKFLEDLVQLKKDYKTPWGDPRVVLNLPYLRNPDYLSLAILPKEHLQSLESDFAYIIEYTAEKLNDKWLFMDREISEMQRVINWFKSLKDDAHQRHLRKRFYSFVVEHDKRRGKDFTKVFPSLKDFYLQCKDYCNNDSFAEG